VRQKSASVDYANGIWALGHAIVAAIAKNYLGANATRVAKKLLPEVQVRACSVHYRFDLPKWLRCREISLKSRLGLTMSSTSQATSGLGTKLRYSIAFCCVMIGSLIGLLSLPVQSSTLHQHTGLVLHIQSGTRLPRRRGFAEF
jgi:hypothetical protein